jgi:hypothetical protein
MLRGFRIGKKIDITTKLPRKSACRTACSCQHGSETICTLYAAILGTKSDAQKPDLQRSVKFYSTIVTGYEPRTSNQIHTRRWFFPSQDDGVASSNYRSIETNGKIHRCFHPFDGYAHISHNLSRWKQYIHMKTFPTGPGTDQTLIYRYKKVQSHTTLCLVIIIKIYLYHFHCLTVHFNSLSIMVQQMHLHMIKH